MSTRRDGAATATAFSAHLSRSELAALLLVVLTLNGFANRIAAALADSDRAVAGGLLGLNAVVLFACFAMVRLALDDQARARATRADTLLALVALVAALVPLKLVSAMALPLVALVLYRSSSPGSAERRIAIIGLALAGSVTLGPALMAFFGSSLTRIETSLLPLFTDLRTDGNVLYGASGGTTFIVGGGCSSFANMTLGIVAVTAFWQLFGGDSTRTMLAWCGIAVTAVIAINTLRLALIGLDPSDYDYLHNGGGADLFMWATELAVLAVAMAAVLRMQRAHAH